MIASFLDYIVGVYLSTLSYWPLRWYFLLSALALALIPFWLHHQKSEGSAVSSFLRYCFPRSIFLHRSAKLDYWFLLLCPVPTAVIFAPALAFSVHTIVYDGVQASFHTFWGAPALQLEPSTAFTIAFVVISYLSYDFGVFFHHYLMHKIPFLWEFHKVHHSAEVLTPATDFRIHPLELLTIPFIGSSLMGAAQGVGNYFSTNPVNSTTFWATNIITYVWVMSYHLRHSHIWLSYGPLVERFLISPAQHQIHHSRDRKHWDRNFGVKLALWDWMFGTLYVPKEKEDLRYGLDHQEPDEFSSVWRLLARPFQRNSRSAPGRIAVVALVAGLLFFSIRFINAQF